MYDNNLNQNDEQTTSAQSTYANEATQGNQASGTEQVASGYREADGAQTPDVGRISGAYQTSNGYQAQGAGQTANGYQTQGAGQTSNGYQTQGAGQTSYGYQAQGTGQTAYGYQAQRAGQTSYEYQGQGAGQTANGYRTYGQNEYVYGVGGTQNYQSAPPQKPKKKGGFFKKAGIVLAIILLFGMIGGAGYYGVNRLMDHFNFSIDINTGNDEKADQRDETVKEQEAMEPQAKQPQTEVYSSIPSTDEEAIAKTPMGEIKTTVTDVTEVVQRVMPAIVSINNTSTQTMSYFGQPISSEAVSTGSGIIVGQNDTEILIATNYHVIENADTLEVVFVDDEKVVAQVKGTDSKMDLAVVAVQVSDIPVSTRNEIALAVLGDSDSLLVGEPAIAIGNALGYGQSVTTGVISALNRTLDMDNKNTSTFIQTDAAINPGNSGGALLNVEGKVIGINSNKIGGAAVEGMGYAIPISAARPIIEDLMNKETRLKVEESKRGYLGISGVSVTEDIAMVYDMPIGVYVAQVYDNTGAQAAGLEEGDIITALNGDTLRSMEDLQETLIYYEKGETITLTVMKNVAGGYEETELTLTLGEKVSDR